MRLPALLLAFGLSTAALAAAPQAGPRADHVPERECLDCHTGQAALWAGSKHERAMQAATPQAVLGDFAGARFAGGGEQARFLQRGERFVVASANEKGEPAELPVSHVLGVYPLQQLLLPQAGGRLQAFPIAWDTREREWFSLYPEGGIAPGSNLHWRGRYQNWNMMCGECHTTAYRKGFDDDRDTYATTWAAPNVGCQACHGGGRAHADSARQAQAEGGGRPLPTANRALAGAHEQVDQCAACHARRTRLVEEALAGAPLLDQFVPDSLRAELYHADGQQLDEVFEYGSYRQSRMYRAGVACTDCHDPHSGKPRAEGNALCVVCHNPAADRGRFPGLQAKDYDSPAHHFHAAGGAASQCVECHMPSRNYMIVHARRDHAIRVPRPDLTARIGTPNACQSCHAERSPQWAAEAIERHFGRRERPEHYGEVFAAARRGEADTLTRLAALVGDPAQPAIVRATSVETLAALGPAPVPPAALRDPDPVVRASAAAALGGRPPAERLAQLPPLLHDPLRAVRIAAARSLADIPEAQLEPEVRTRRRALLADFVAAQQAMADMPSAQFNLAALARVEGDAEGAERHYRRAIGREPGFQAARLGLATLLAAHGREEEAGDALRAGLPVSADPAALHLALGLLAGQRQRWEEAARELQAAAALQPDNPQIRRNLDAVQRYLARTRGR